MLTIHRKNRGQIVCTCIRNSLRNSWRMLIILNHLMVKTVGGTVALLTLVGVEQWCETYTYTVFLSGTLEASYAICMLNPVRNSGRIFLNLNPLRNSVGSSKMLIRCCCFMFTDCTYCTCGSQVSMNHLPAASRYLFFPAATRYLQFLIIISDHDDVTTSPSQKRSTSHN